MAKALLAWDRRDCLRHLSASAAGLFAAPALYSAWCQPAFASSLCRGRPLLTGEHGFKYFDELYYVGKPDLLSQGLSPVHVAYAWQIWGERRFDGEIEHQVPYDSIASYPRRYGLDTDPPAMVILDIEHWPLYRAPLPEIEKTLKLCRQVLVAFRQVLPPGTRLSYYHIGPLPVYFYTVERGYRTSDYTRWRKENDLLAPLIECFDFMVPSLYLGKSMTIEQWKRRATDFIAEARRLAGDGRMVIPFLWPQYTRERPYEHIPGEIWREMLALIRDQADSVVLWRRAGGPTASTWEETAGWWQETRKFLNEPG